jgi:hypothetical protein
MEKEPGQQKKPKKAQKKGVDYTNTNSIFLSSSNELDYIRKMNKRLQYNLCLLFRAELLKRGWTVKAVQMMLKDNGCNIGLASLNTIVSGNSYRWNLLVLFKIGYILGIDIDVMKISDAHNYIKLSGRSVKDL